MAHEKQYTAKQAAVAVLDKINDLLKKSELMKSELEKAQIDTHLGLNPQDKKIARGYRQAFNKDPLAAKKPGMNIKKCESCGGDMEKGEESKHDRCVRHVEANSPDVKNPHAVCVAEGVKPAAWKKSELESDFESLKALFKYEPENSKKLGKEPAKEGYQNKEHRPEASDHAFEVKSGKESTSPDQRVAQQKDPQHNAKEQSEGNNELAGTTPTQVGQDGKNMPGGDEIKGHLKLAKFVGRMAYKRESQKKNQQVVASQQSMGNSQASASAQHSESIRNK